MKKNIFVGRSNTLDACIGFLGKLNAGVNVGTIFVTVRGQQIDKEDKGGIGKTQFLFKLDEIIQEKLKFRTSGVIDLKATSSRSGISLLFKIARELHKDTNKGMFDNFFEHVDEYNNAKEQKRVELFDLVAKSFINSFAISPVPQIILLDTFESIQNIELSFWIINVLKQLGSRVAIVIAGRHPIPLSGVEVFSTILSHLNHNEIYLLGQEMFAKRGLSSDYDIADSLIAKICYLTDGRPILAVLAFEWILENVQQEIILSVQKSEFEAMMVRFLKLLVSDQNIIIVMMATIDRRFTTAIMAMLTGWDRQKCIEMVRDITRFAFVKIIEDSTSEHTSLTLHDEMLRIVVLHADFPEYVKNIWRKQVIEMFYDPEIEQATEIQHKHTLIAEKLYYLLQHAPEEGVKLFDSQMQLAISNYEFDYCQLLLSEVNVFRDRLDLILNNIIDLNYAEMLVKAYQPLDAKPLFDKLIVGFDIESYTHFFSRAISGLGMCIAQGSTVSEDNIYEAITLLQGSLDLCVSKQINERVATILYEIGFCYDLLGLNEQTLEYFLQSNKIARSISNFKLVTNTLDEIGKLRLRCYEVPEALELFLESLEVKQKNQDAIGMSTSYHQIGNAYRDIGSGNFSEAIRWYQLAENAKKKISDDLGLCELYSDIGWLHLLEKNWEKARFYLEKQYYDYALAKRFGREIADAEHSMYHLVLETQGVENATPWIEKSFENAKKYSNTFIFLDATLHLIEIAYEKQDFERITHLYTQMEDLENKGCGYKMFRGRAVNILGDIQFDNKNYQEALKLWKDGYIIIAIHGRSRSATTTFDDYLELRYSKIIKALCACGLTTTHMFLDIWNTTALDKENSTMLGDEYPGLTGIVYLAIGDMLYDLNLFNEALQSWLQGFLNIALQVSVKFRSRTFKLSPHIESRKIALHKIFNQDVLRTQQIVAEFTKKSEDMKSKLTEKEHSEFKTNLAILIDFIKKNTKDYSDF